MFDRRGWGWNWRKARGFLVGEATEDRVFCQGGRDSLSVCSLINCKGRTLAELLEAEGAGVHVGENLSGSESVVVEFDIIKFSVEFFGGSRECADLYDCVVGSGGASDAARTE